MTEWRTTAYVQEQTAEGRWVDVETDGFGPGVHEVEVNSDLADCQLTCVKIAPYAQVITDDTAWEDPTDANDPNGDADYGYEA